MCYIVGLVVLTIPEIRAQSSTRFHDSKTIDTFFRYQPDRKRPLILAHRGGPQPSETENSLETFKHTYQQIPDAILEMDVRMTADSVLAMLHDDDIKRTTTGTGSFRAMSWNALHEVYLRDLQGNPTKQRIPLFSDILRWGAGKVTMAIDAKPGVDLRRVMSEIVKSGALYSVFIICYSVDDAKRLRSLYPDLWIALGINQPEQIETLKQAGLSLNRVIGLASLQGIDFYQKVHQAHVPCTASTYGPNNLDEKPMNEAADEYRKLFQIGVDILTTDRPVEVSKLFN